MLPNRLPRASILTPGVTNIIIINIMMFVATQMKLFHIDFYETFSLFYITSPNFKWWQPFTHMFMHVDREHIFGNMLGLFIFGPMLEQVWGTRRFIFFYLVCGLGGAFCNMLVQGYEFNHLNALAAQFNSHPVVETALKIYDDFSFILKKAGNAMLPELHDLSQNANNQEAIGGIKDVIAALHEFYMRSRALGASGAIFGVILGCGMMFPRRPMWLLFLPISIQARYIAFAYGAYELYSSFNDQTSNIAHFAHLGGMLFGIILILHWNKKLRKTFY